MQIAGEELGFPVGKPLHTALLDRFDRTVGGDEVEPAVVVEIEPGGAEPGMAETHRAKARRDTHIFEQAGTKIPIEVVSFGRQLRHEEIFGPVIVEIAGVDAHAALRLTVCAHGHAGEQARVLECTVPLVHPQDVFAAVVGHVKVDPAVVVEIGGRDAKRRTEGTSGQCCRRHVGERAVPVVVKQPIALRAVHGWSAVVAPAGQAGALLIRLNVPDDIIADVQVQPSIAVVVEERRGDAPSRDVSAALFRYVGERSIAVITKQLVAPEIRDVQVDAAIVVEIGCGDTHAVPAGIDSALFGDVGEIERARSVRVHHQVISEQAPFEGHRGGWDGRLAQCLSLAEHLSLHEEDIEVAIIVVVQERNPARQHLGKIEFAGHPVEIGERQAALVRPVDKPLAARGVRAACSARCRRARVRRRV